MVRSDTGGHPPPSVSLEMRLFRLLRTWTTPTLVAIFLALLVVYFYSIGVVSLEWFRKNKDAVTAIGSLCTAGTVIVGGALSYLRFFRGRTFVRRVELSLEVEVIHGPGNLSLHLVAVSAKNIGTVAIWEPELVVHVAARHSDGTTAESTINRWLEDSYCGMRGFHVLDSDESSHYSAEKCFDKSVWAVIYTAVLSTTNESWSKSRAIKSSANLADMDGSERPWFGLRNIRRRPQRS